MAPRSHRASITDAITNFNIADILLGTDKHKDKVIKLPKDFLKILQQKVQDIAMGRDSQNQDMHLRSTMGRFFAKFHDPAFKKTMQEGRRINELFMLFIPVATATAKKEFPDGTEWKQEMIAQIASFVLVCRSILKNMSGAASDLITKLDDISELLNPLLDNDKPSTSNTFSSSPISNRANLSPQMTTPYVRSKNVYDNTMIQTVKALWNKGDDEFCNDIKMLQNTVSERDALNDLKLSLRNLNAQGSQTIEKTEFRNPELYETWRKSEISALTQLMAIMVKSKGSSITAPSSISRSPRPESTSISDTKLVGPSRSSKVYSVNLGQDTLTSDTSTLTVDFENESRDNHSAYDEAQDFVFRPIEPKECYEMFLMKAMEFDLEAINNDTSESEVSIGILTNNHLDLLHECVVRWRISTHFPTVSLLHCMHALYNPDAKFQVLHQCVEMSVLSAQTELDEAGLESWPISEANAIVDIYHSLLQDVLGRLYELVVGIIALQVTWDEEISLDIICLSSIVNTIDSSNVLQSHGFDLLPPILNDLSERIRLVCSEQYSVKADAFENMTFQNIMEPLLQLSLWIEDNAKTLNKKFPSGILDVVDPVAHLLELQVPLFLEDLRESQVGLLSELKRDSDAFPLKDVFTVYKRVRMLIRMHKQAVKKPLLFNVGDVFQPFVEQYLVNCNIRIAQWVDRAIQHDEFTPEGDDRHSSSIIDLFSSLLSSVDFIETLKWPVKLQNALFFTHLSKIISQAIEIYCKKTEELFLEDIFPKNVPVDQVLIARQDVWLAKVKSLYGGGEKQVEPFHFEPKSCVKLNNIDAARRQLDILQERLNVDEVFKLTESQFTNKKKNPVLNFLFTLHIVGTEELLPSEKRSNGTMDLFVKVTDEMNSKVAKTRTIFNTLNPRWEEVFDISVTSAKWVQAVVYNRSMIGEHDVVGKVYLLLDPKNFGDCLTHELSIALDGSGKLLLKVSMEGEKDDIQFHFGRAFRSLKSRETNMTRVIVDKMGEMIRHCMSRSVLKNLCKTGGALTDLQHTAQQTMLNVTSWYGKLSIRNDQGRPEIPLPSSGLKSSPFLSKKKVLVLSESEMVAALDPLLDYLHHNFATLASAFNDSVKVLVMLKVWKEVLIIIEGQLVPPLTEGYSEMKVLSAKEVEVIFVWLQYLLAFFNARDDQDNVEHGVPMELLKSQRYTDLITISVFYDEHSDKLMMEASRQLQESLQSSTASMLKRSRSVYQESGIGTIKKRKQTSGKGVAPKPSNGEIILRILKLRPEAEDFVKQQVRLLSDLRADAAKPKSQLLRNGNDSRSRNFEPGQKGNHPVPMPAPITLMPQPSNVNLYPKSR